MSAPLPLARSTFAIFLLLGLGASAAAPAQTGLPVEGYVWSETSGWINLSPTFGGVSWYPTHLAGFAWSESIGWIQLSSDSRPPFGNTSADDWGVNRDPTTGDYSGYAWSENAGWIRFDPSFSGVSLDQNGDFSGFAWSATLGWIHFESPTEIYGGSADVPDVTVPTLDRWGLLALLGALSAFALRRLREPSAST